LLSKLDRSRHGEIRKRAEEYEKANAETPAGNSRQTPKVPPMYPFFPCQATAPRQSGIRQAFDRDRRLWRMPTRFGAGMTLGRAMWKTEAASARCGHSTMPYSIRRHIGRVLRQRTTEITRQRDLVRHLQRRCHRRSRALFYSPSVFGSAGEHSCGRKLFAAVVGDQIFDQDRIPCRHQAGVEFV